MELLEQLFRESYNDKVRMVYRRAGGSYNADDVIQEAFARALQYQDSFNGATMEDLNKWFDCILRRSLYDFKRSEIKQGLTQEELKEEDPDADIVDADGIDSRTAEELTEVIESYSRPKRDILYLYFIRGYKSGEVAQVLDLTAKQVRNYVHQFKLNMREMYA